MLWRTLLCCLVLAGAVSVDAWKKLYKYQYGVSVRTLTSNSEVAEVYTGSLIELILDITTMTENEFTAKISSAQDASLKPTYLQEGWASLPPQESLRWQNLSISLKPFHVILNQNGTLKNINFEQGVDDQQKKFLSDIISQFVIAPLATPSKKEPFVNPPVDKDSKFAAFHKYENSSLGECDVICVIKPQTAAEALHQHYSIDGEMENNLVITKFWNFSNCKSINKFTMGLSDPGNAQLPISRSFQTRAVISGDLKNFTITMVEANSTFSVPLQLYNKQKSMVATNFKATLLSQTQNLNPLPKPQHPEGSKNSLLERPQNYQGYMNDDRRFGSAANFPYPDVFLDQSYRWNSKLPLPYHTGYKGERIGDALGRNISELVGTLAEIIAENPSEKLEQVIIAVKYMRTMYMEEIVAAHNIVVQKEQHAEIKGAGKVLRYIAALSGTPYSLKFLWLIKDKIQIQELAQLLSVQREVALNPNYHYLETMKQIVIEVDKMYHQDKQALHNLRMTVGLTFTDILRMAGRKYKDITASVVDYYTKRLEEAIKTDNNEELQLIIALMGNVAHKSILDKLYKIINGEWSMTEHIRLHACVSLGLLTAIHPNGMYKLWFSVFANTSLPHQLRCQAVPNLMRSNPPGWVLQQMAEATHNESNPHVIAQVSSAIRSAAKLRGPYNLELAQNARAAVSLLKPEEFDAGYSGAIFDSYKINGMDLSYTQLLNYIGSQDSLLPSSFQYFVDKNYNGYRTLAWQASGMVTSINDTLEAILSGLFQTHHPEGPAEVGIPTSTFPRIHVEKRSKLEGNFYIPRYGFWSFDAKILKNKIADLIANIDGKTIPLEAMKMGNAKEVMFAVPNGIGLTFVYTYTSVYLANIKGNVRLQKHFHKIIKSGESSSASLELKAEGNIDVTLAMREEGKVGFVTPWNSMDYMNGVNSDTRVRAPIDGSVGVKFDTKWNDIEVSADVGLPDSDPVNIFQRSTEPYVTSIWLPGNTTITGNPNTTLLHTKPPVTVNSLLGKGSTGMAMRLDYYSEIDAAYANIAEESQFLKEKSWWSMVYRWLYQQYKDYDSFSLIHFPFAARDIHISSFNLTYVPWESTANTARFTWRIGGFPTPAGLVGASKPQRYRLHPKSLGVPFAVEAPPQQEVSAKGSFQRQVLFNATFEGKTVAVFGLHAALSGNVMNQSFSSAIELWSKPAEKHQFNAALELSFQVPQVNLMNFKKALSGSPNSSIDALLTVARPTWAKPAVVSLTGNFGRTPQRREYIRESPMGRACLKEMDSGLNIQRTCQNVTYWANSLDAFEVNIRYKHIPVEIKRAVYAAYFTARQAAYSQLQEEVFHLNPFTNTISVKLYVNNQSTAFNLSIQSSLVNTNVTNFPLPSWAKPIIPNAGLSFADRVGQHFYPLNYAPSFVLDNGQVVTFDGKRYPLKASPCWYIAVAYAPKWQANAPIGEQQVYNVKDLKRVVLVRQTEDGLLETKIIDNDLVVELRGQPDSPTPAIYVNGEVTELEPEQSIPIGEEAVIYILHNGEVALHSRFAYIYHGARRVKITLDSSMKDSILGLGGNSNGDRQDDFMSPAGCITNDYEAFQAEWADCKLPYKESKCVFIQNNTVYPRQPVLRSQRIGSPYPRLPPTIFDDFDSSSESTEWQEDPSLVHYPRDFRPFLDLGGQGSTSQSDEQTSQTSAGVHLSLPDFEGRLDFPQTSHPSVIYKTDIIHVEGLTCFSIKPVRMCKDNLSPKQEEKQEVQYHCMPDGPIAEMYEENAKRFNVLEDFKRKTVHKILKKRVPVECRNY